MSRGDLTPSTMDLLWVLIGHPRVAGVHLWPTRDEFGAPSVSVELAGADRPPLEVTAETFEDALLSTLARLEALEGSPA